MSTNIAKQIKTQPKVAPKIVPKVAPKAEPPKIVPVVVDPPQEKSNSLKPWLVTLTIVAVVGAAVGYYMNYPMTAMGLAIAAVVAAIWRMMLGDVIGQSLRSLVPNTVKVNILPISETQKMVRLRYAYPANFSRVELVYDPLVMEFDSYEIERTFRGRNAVKAQKLTSHKGTRLMAEPGKYSITVQGSPYDQSGTEILELLDIRFYVPKSVPNETIRQRIVNGVEVRRYRTENTFTPAQIVL